MIHCSDSASFENQSNVKIDNLEMESIIFEVPMILLEFLVSGSITNANGSSIDIYGSHLIQMIAVMSLNIAGLSLASVSNRMNGIGLLQNYLIAGSGVPNAELKQIRVLRCSNVGVAKFERKKMNNSVTYLSNSISISELIVREFTYALGQATASVVSISSENLSMDSITVQDSSMDFHFMELSIVNALLVDGMVAEDIVLENSTMVLNSSEVSTISNCKFTRVQSVGFPPAMVLLAGKKLIIEASDFVQLINLSDIKSNSNEDKSGCVNLKSILSVSLVMVSFMECSGSTYSGALTMQDIKSGLILSSTFLRNAAHRYSGGAAYILGSKVEIDSCVFEGNSAVQERGGAIAVGESQLSVKRTLMQDN